MLEGYLQRVVDVGDLTVAVGGGAAAHLWRRLRPAPSHIRLKPGAAVKLAMNPELKLGECFMDGELVFEQGDMFEPAGAGGRQSALLEEAPDRGAEAARGGAAAACSRMNDRHARPAQRGPPLRPVLRTLRPIPGCGHAVILCAYFSSPGDTLEEAQAAKKAHISRQAEPAPGGAAAGHRLRVGRPGPDARPHGAGDVR